MYSMKQKWVFSTTQVIILSFLAAILTGTALLMLPISSAEGNMTSFVDALFTATTCICVTGLVVVDTYSYWSIFGQCVILLLIQLGGLGIITFTTTILMAMGRKVTLKDRLLLEDAFNMDTLQGLVRFLRSVLMNTFVVETAGAILYMFYFVPEMGAKGIWISVFTSISAFCNAGIDVIGPYSLMPYVGNVWINLVTMGLIVFGGLGFIVWRDLYRVLRRVRNKDILPKQIFWKLTLHSKLAIATTAGLIVIGAFLFFLFEYRNPQTMGNMSVGEKVLASFFQSVTTRTAGFASISQKDLRSSSVLLTMALMFIGGSPVGTAGGIKTVTLAVIIMTAVSTAKGSEHVNVFRRAVPLVTIRKAYAVGVISMAALLIGIVLMLTFQPGDASDVIFEITSAMGTAGLSRSFTPSLNLAGKLIICLFMFMGRVGPISMAIAFSFKRNKGTGRLPEEKVTVG